MKMIKGPKIECEKCHKQYEIGVDVFDGQDVQWEERSDGRETHYIWEYEATCIFCNSNITVEIEGWEYPEGALNHESYEGTGYKIIEKPILEVYI